MELHNKEVVAVKEGQDFDRAAFHAYMLKHVEWWPDEPMEVTQFSAGFSNLTYLIRCGETEVVMRRRPFGPLPPKAHDMVRECTLLQKLHDAYPYVAKTYVLCADESVIGAPFYVMERKRGWVFDGEYPAGFEAATDTAEKISHAVVDTLAKLHQVNYKEIGLERFGRPEGFLTRQVDTWIKRYDKFRTHELPQFEPLAKWFAEHVPTSPHVAIIHNDYKLNNMMFSYEDIGQVTGIFDWEMATVADPYVDLAIALGYWSQPDDWESVKKALPSLTTKGGFLNREQFIHRYALKTGFDVPPLYYHMAFTYFKIAVVSQQIYYRWFHGQATDERFGALEHSIRSLMEYAYEIVQTKKF